LQTLVKKTKSEITSLVLDFSEHVHEIYGELLDKVIVFGSCARGDYDEESDIDIMILIDGNEEEFNKFKDKLLDLTVEKNLENDVLIATIVEEKKKFDTYLSVLPFFINIQEEGLVIYDKRNC
jgi:predicted nucleotidyltransferase